MTGSGSPCGACKFLRRKCAKGCVFAPYFCHEQGAAHFSAIHKVFGASNVSKLLAHLPVCDRSEAAVTISYEAQARLQDPIYGCVSHIFALQQQVVSLQAQLANLKQQAAHTMLNGGGGGPTTTQSPKPSSSNSYPQDVQSWLQSEYPQMLPPFDPYLNCSGESSTLNYGGGFGGGGNHNHNNNNSHGSMVQEDHVSFGNSFDGCSSSHNSMASVKYENNSDWPYQEADDLRSVAFGYPQYS